MNNFYSRSDYASKEADAIVTVGHSFRCGVLASYSSQDAYWSYAWQQLAKLSRNHEIADHLLRKLSIFVDKVLASSTRSLDILPNGCPGLCRDECLAVSIIVASQFGPCPALKACAFALLENSHMEPCINSALSLGSALKETGIPLSTMLVNDDLKWTFPNTEQKLFNA